MDYKIFCFIVFIIQSIITFVDFKLAQKHFNLCKKDAASADILASVSWGMTALWWLYQGFTAPID